MLRVRPAQLTTTVVPLSIRSCTRRTSSPPGQDRPVGMLMRLNSRRVRESSTTKSRPSTSQPASSAAVTCGVPKCSSTSSPNSLDGTLMPEYSSPPAAAQASMPPSSTAAVGVAQHGQLQRDCRSLSPAAVADDHRRIQPWDAGRHLQAHVAERQVRRIQQVAAGELGGLTGIHQRQLGAVTAQQPPVQFRQLGRRNGANVSHHTSLETGPSRPGGDSGIGRRSVSRRPVAMRLRRRPLSDSPDGLR